MSEHKISLNLSVYQLVCAKACIATTTLIGSWCNEIKVSALLLSFMVHSILHKSETIGMIDITSLLPLCRAALHCTSNTYRNVLLFWPVITGMALKTLGVRPCLITFGRESEFRYLQRCTQEVQRLGRNKHVVDCKALSEYQLQLFTVVLPSSLVPTISQHVTLWCSSLCIAMVCNILPTSFIKTSGNCELVSAILPNSTSCQLWMICRTRNRDRDSQDLVSLSSNWRPWPVSGLVCMLFLVKLCVNLTTVGLIAAEPSTGSLTVSQVCPPSPCPCCGDLLHRIARFVCLWVLLRSW